MLRKKLTAFFLSLALLLALLPVVPAFADGAAVFNGVSYSDNYTTWRQSDPAWKDLPLGNSSYNMGDSGCLVTAVAILMCHAECYPSTQLNPGSLVQWLNQKGYFTEQGGLYYGKMTATTCPRFVYSSQDSGDTKEGMERNLSYACQTIESLQKKGCSVIVRVNSPTGRAQHFVAVRYLFGDSDAVICDPGSGYTRLSQYSEYRGFICFKPNPDGKDTIFNGAAAPAPIPVSAPDSGGAVIPTVVTPFTPDSGGAAAPADGNSTAPVVSGVSVTITYDNNWVVAGRTTQSAQSGGHYNLITPYRDNAAFLGWYRDGVMVTNSSVVPSQNHTLVARWDTRGFGYQPGASYDERFTDVNRSAWYYSDMTKAFSYGLMNGVDDRTFAPNDKIPVYQAITLAARINKQYYEGNTDFGSSKPWYMAPAGYAQSCGIIDSLSMNFEEPITRLDFANMLSKAIPASALPEVNTIGQGAIPDVGAGEKEIYRLYRAGVLQGYEQGAFHPDDTITRAEAATLLVRLVDPNARTLFSLQ